MKQYFIGLITGILFTISAIAFMGAHNDYHNYGKYQFTTVVQKNIDGQEFTATDYGVGPVDASLNAIQKITSQITDEVRLKEYKLDSISGGANALCEVTVKVEDVRGNIISSKSVGEDIVTTSVQAMVDGINRIMLKNLLKEKKI